MSSVRLSVGPSALGPVIVALASAAPELDFTLIHKLTDDKRSVVFDGAVRSFGPSVTLRYVFTQFRILRNNFMAK